MLYPRDGTIKGKQEILFGYSDLSAWFCLEVPDNLEKWPGVQRIHPPTFDKAEPIGQSEIRAICLDLKTTRVLVAEVEGKMDRFVPPTRLALVAPVTEKVDHNTPDIRVIKRDPLFLQGHDKLVGVGRHFHAERWYLEEQIIVAALTQIR